jgi:hypothetical protein
VGGKGHSQNQPDFRENTLRIVATVKISNMRKPGKARAQILKILPKLRKTASNILRIYGVPVFAFGKQSVPVRIAELTSGAHAIRYATDKAVKENVKLRLGLPTKWQSKFLKNGIALQSLMPTENEVIGYAECSRDLLEGTQILDMLNPCARGFKMLEITRYIFRYLASAIIFAAVSKPSHLIASFWSCSDIS